MASIPLPALHIQPPENPLDQAGKVLQLKSLMQGQALQQQQLQGATLQNQIAQQQVQDMKNIRAAYTDPSVDWSKPDAWDKFTSAIQKNGGASPQTLFQLNATRLDQKAKLAQIDKDTLAADKERSNQLLGRLDGYNNLPDEQKATAWPGVIKQAVNDGLIKDPNVAQKLLSTPAPDNDTLKAFENGLLDHTTQVDLAIKKQEADAKDWKEMPGTGTLMNVRTGETKSGGVMMPLPQKTATDAGIPDMAGKPFSPQMIKAITDATGEGKTFQNAGGHLWLVDKEGNKLKDMGVSTPVVTANINAGVVAPGAPAPGTGGGGAAPQTTVGDTGLTQEALDQSAEKYFQTGQLPPAIRGVAGLRQNRAIMNRAAELHPGGSLAANSAEFKANQSSLVQLQKNLDAVSAFENTAKKNLDILLTQGKKVADSGSPFLNTPIRLVSDKMLGNTDVPAWNAARQVAVNEIAKVTSNPTLVGQLSDTARKEVESFIPANATFNQIFRVADILRQDMKNRHQGLQDQVNDIKSRMKSSSTTTPANQNQHSDIGFVPSSK